VKDLLVITPTRGRPDQLKTMVGATLGLSEAATHVAVAVDDDDVMGYFMAREQMGDEPRVWWFTGPRDTLTGWTNKLAARFAGEYRAVASLGDDHLPKTQGWDRLLLDALDGMGGTGIAYGDDTIMSERLPTAPVISSDIVRALGWMCLPALRHMCVDLVWKDLGHGAGCIAYVPSVTVEHLHWGQGKSPLDATYAEAESRHQEDRDAYAAWREDGMTVDVDTVRALREPQS
jgi:hypothetical protein